MIIIYILKRGIKGLTKLNEKRVISFTWVKINLWLRFSHYIRLVQLIKIRNGIIIKTKYGDI